MGSNKPIPICLLARLSPGATGHRNRTGLLDRREEPNLHFFFTLKIINRPGVAGAVLQSPMSIDYISDWVSNPLVKIFSKHSQSQSGRARELKFWENVHPTLYVMCHVSCVTCHVSRHLSHVKLYIYIFILKIKLDKVVELVGGWSVINGAYPV